MPIETRRARGYHSDRLRAVAAEIATSQEHTVDCKGTPAWCEDYTATFRFTGLWVFGSWARGAVDCGDLDIVVSIEPTQGSPAPHGHTVANHVRRGRRLLDVQVGPPSRLGDVAKDAILIWSPDLPDYDAAIDAVDIRPTQGRFVRPSDVLVVDPRRVRMPMAVREDLPAAVTAGRYAVNWSPFDTPGNLEPRHENIGAYLRLGKDSARVLPMLLKAVGRVRDPDQLDRNLFRGNPRSRIEGLGVVGSLGSWHLRPSELDQLTCSALMMVPHWRSRLGNGVLTITRGPQHPLVQAFAGRGAFAVGTGIVDTSAGGWTCRVLELFADRADMYPEDKEEAVLLQGEALLHALAGADAVWVDGLEVALNYQGEQTLEAMDAVLEADPARQVELLVEAIPEVPDEGHATTASSQ